MNPPTFLRSIRVALLCSLALFSAVQPSAAQSGSNTMSDSDATLLKALHQDVRVAQRMSSYALNEGKSSRLRSLAQGIVEALKFSAGDIKRLAQKKSVTVDDALTGKPDDVADKLNDANGDEFDRMYVDALLTYLPRIQQQCETALARTTDEDFKALLKQSVSMLKEKVEAARAVKAKM